MLPVDGSYGSPPVPGPQYLPIATKFHAGIDSAWLQCAHQRDIGQRRLSTTRAERVIEGAQIIALRKSEEWRTHWLFPPEPFFQPSGSKFRVHEPDDGVYPSPVNRRTSNILSGTAIVSSPTSNPDTTGARVAAIVSAAAVALQAL